MTTETAPPSDGANIHAALLAVMQKVGYVHKTGRNPHHDYSYASETDLIHVLRPAMIDAGITPTVVGIEVVLSNAGHIVAKYTMRYTHAASGSFVEATALGEGKDAQDKAAYKAATGALKYLLRQTFLMETGDDPDHGNGDGAEKAPAQAAAPNPPITTELQAQRHYAAAYATAQGKLTPGQFDDVDKAQCRAAYTKALANMGGDYASLVAAVRGGLVDVATGDLLEPAGTSA